MTAELESKIERDSIAAALLLGVTSAKMKADGQNGFPDRIFFIPGGSPLFIEFKRPGGTLSSGQRIMIRRLKHYGYAVSVVDTVDDAIRAISAALNKRK